jgi:hypothetical protein
VVVPQRVESAKVSGSADNGPPVIKSGWRSAFRAGGVAGAEVAVPSWPWCQAIGTRWLADDDTPLRTPFLTSDPPDSVRRRLGHAFGDHDHDVVATDATPMTRR